MKFFSTRTIFFCVLVCAKNFFPAASSCKQSFLCVCYYYYYYYYYYYIYLYTVKIHQVILCSKNTNLNITA